MVDENSKDGRNSDPRVNYMYRSLWVLICFHILCVVLFLFMFSFLKMSDVIEGGESGGTGKGDLSAQLSLFVAVGALALALVVIEARPWSDLQSKNSTLDLVEFEEYRGKYVFNSLLVLGVVADLLISLSLVELLQELLNMTPTVVVILVEWVGIVLLPTIVRPAGMTELVKYVSNTKKAVKMLSKIESARLRKSRLRNLCERLCSTKSGEVLLARASVSNHCEVCKGGMNSVSSNRTDPLITFLETCLEESDKSSKVNLFWLRFRVGFEMVLRGFGCSLVPILLILLWAKVPGARITLNLFLLFFIISLLVSAELSRWTAVSMASFAAIFTLYPYLMAAFFFFVFCSDLLIGLVKHLVELSWGTWKISLFILDFVAIYSLLVAFVYLRFIAARTVLFSGHKGGRRLRVRVIKEWISEVQEARGGAECLLEASDAFGGRTESGDSESGGFRIRALWKNVRIFSKTASLHSEKITEGERRLARFDSELSQELKNDDERKMFEAIQSVIKRGC
ncbi:hypothetical protein [Schaalia cardiffensis]